MAEKKTEGIGAALPLLTLAMLLVSGLAFVFPEISARLIYDREAIQRGEVWRLLSAHCVHFTAPHLAYNLLAFGAAGWLVERKSPRCFGLLYLAMALGIGVALYLLHPAMRFYGGLSGLACGFIFYCALAGAEEPGPWKTICELLILLLPLKIILEVGLGASLLPYGGEQPFVIMPLSHLAGLAVALLVHGTEKWPEQKTLESLPYD